MAHRLETQTIYEIFRACRLCGSGGGYKMPIIQSVLPLERSDVELKQKIQECVHIEVKEDDKMPPLICELCIDKVNDFYEFLDMCRQTNVRTRRRLGLPAQSVQQGASDTEDCILGVTEQICPKSNSDNRMPAPKNLKHTLVRSVKISKDENAKKESEWSIKGKDDRHDRKGKKGEKGNEKHRNGKEESDGKGKKDDKDKGGKEKEEVRKEEGGRRWQRELEDLKMQAERVKLDSSRSSRSSRAESRSSSTSSRSSRGQVTSPPAPPQRETRRSAACDSDNLSLSRLRHQDFQNNPEKSKPPVPKPILKKDIKKEPLSVDETLLVPRGKRTREKVVLKLEPSPPKKVKITEPRKPSPPPKPSPRAAPKSARPPPPNSCQICLQSFKSPQALVSHMRAHAVTYTKPMLACNACGEWFLSPEETKAHHKRHRKEALPYHCRRCGYNFIHQKTYDEHFAAQCVPWKVVPEVKCHMCSKSFVTQNLRSQHKCAALQDGSHQCGCGRYYGSQKTLKVHQKKCSKKKKGARLSVPTVSKKMKIDAKLQRKLKPVQVRVARCDPILRRKGGRYNVSNVPALYGLDENCVYPFLYRHRIKSEPLDFDGMVSIKQEIRDEFYKEEDYVHWDSDLSTDSEEETEVTSFITSPFGKRKRVDSLTTLSLKTIFSKRCLGKVPRKLRKVKSDKLFDSVFNVGEFENDVTFNDSINNIIGTLNDADDSRTINLTVDNDNDSCKAVLNETVSNNINYDSDSLLEDQDKSISVVTNADFDSLFKTNDETDNDATRTDDKSEEKSSENHENDTRDSTIEDSKTRDEQDNDTVSLNSQISDKTECESGHNSDLMNNKLDTAVEENDETAVKDNDKNGSEEVIEDSVLSDKVNGKSKNVNNYNDIISVDVESKLLDDLIGDNETEKGFSLSKRKLNIVTKGELKSLDLDNVSDEEFNFDV